MAKHNQSPIRDQARTEILAALAGGEYMSIDQIFNQCETISDRGELARLAYDMTRNGTLEKGEQILNKQNKAVNTYRIGTGHTPSADHPWKQATVTPKQPVEPRVTRPLPVHLQTPIPPVWAAQEGVECPPEEYLDQALIDAISQLKEEDTIMTEESAGYMTTEEQDLAKAMDLDEDIEAKTANAFAAGRDSEWGESHTDQVPESYLVQAAAYQDLTGCQYQDLAKAMDLDEDIEAKTANALEASRLAIVDAMLAYAHDELRGNRTWKSLERAYLAVSGDNLGSRHG